MNNSSKISVIVPCFNSEKTIERCIKSITNSAYENLECIVINDGSTDGSLEVCESLAKKDDRIIVCNSESNKGISSARNTGLRAATGKWAIGVDSDDWVDENYFGDLIEMADHENLDCVIANCKRFEFDHDDNERFVEYRKAFSEEFITDEKKLLYFLQANACAARVNYDYIDVEALRSVATPWDKIFNLDIIKKNNLAFISSCDGREDIIFSLYYLNYCNRVGYIHNFGYNYRLQANSSCHGFFKDIVGRDVNAKNELVRFMEMVKDDSLQLQMVQQGIYVAFIRFFIEEMERYVYNDQNEEANESESAVKKILSDAYLMEAAGNVDLRNLSDKERDVVKLINDHDVAGVGVYFSRGETV